MATILKLGCDFKNVKSVVSFYCLCIHLKNRKHIKTERGFLCLECLIRFKFDNVNVLKNFRIKIICPTWPRYLGVKYGSCVYICKY